MFLGLLLTELVSSPERIKCHCNKKRLPIHTQEIKSKQLEGPLGSDKEE